MSFTKIAFVDSGIGGLMFCIDVVANIKNKYDISNVDFIHIGDTKNIPYGEKSNDELLLYLQELIKLSLKLDANIIVIACNTLCAVISKEIIEKYKKNGVKIVSIIEKSADFLYQNCKITNNEKNICILGTLSTVKNMRYYNYLKKLGGDNNLIVNIAQYAPKMWVKYIENSQISTEMLKKNVHEQLDEIKKQDENFNKISAIGLFCTHYRYIENEIIEYCRQNFKNYIFITSQGVIFSDEIARITQMQTGTANEKIIKSYITQKSENFLKQHVINSAKKHNIAIETYDL